MPSSAASAASPAPIAAEELVLLPDEAATVALGARIGEEVEPGDVVALSGDIGAGKTTLARSVLRTRLGDPDLVAPSPTFTLVQSYESAGGPVIHADLYRIGGEGELVELGFDEWRDGSVLIVEWPERAPTLLDVPRVDVRLDLDPDTGGRVARIAGRGALFERLQRAGALARMLERAGWDGAERIRLQGDASTRAYERLVQPTGETAILMISPPRPDGPPVRRGRPYSAIARLAESVHAFAAMDRALGAAGYSAPAILAEDLGAGLLLIEDFGAEPVVDANGPMPERYGEATRLLADLHATVRPDGPGQPPLPPYDMDALLIEVELLLDWYVPRMAGTQPSGSSRAEFGHIWREALEAIVAAPASWVLRDYHSPNLIWLPERDGLRRIGLLDFQDAVLGHPAYDVASLLQDARVTVPAELELKLLGLYAAERKAGDPGFDFAGFATAYAILAAQRATKILGIFARLDRRDGKPQYLAHLPRIRAYLARNLAHPALARLRAWFESQLPGDVTPREPPAAVASLDSPDSSETPAAPPPLAPAATS